MAQHHSSDPRVSNVSSADLPAYGNDATVTHIPPSQRSGRVSPMQSEAPNTPPLLPQREAEPLTSEFASSMNEQEKSVPQSPPRLRVARRHALAVFLLFCYIPFLVVPWVMTCILSYHPFGYSSYYLQDFSFDGYFTGKMVFWLGFIDTVNSIGFLITIPVISAMLAQGAVVYLQRRSSNTRLSLAQTFALSDRAWADLSLLPHALFRGQIHTPYLFSAWILIIMAIAQAPLREGLTSREVITVVTCADDATFNSISMPGCRYPKDHVVLAYDAVASVMKQVPQTDVVHSLTSRLATTTLTDVQPHMWLTDPIPANGANYFSGYAGDGPPQLGTVLGTKHRGYVASAVPYGLYTGALREHALSLGSSVNCSLIPQQSFPLNCSGTQPFMRSFNNNATGPSVRLCVPGNYTQYPWTNSASVQTIQEQLYLSVEIPYPGNNGWITGPANNFTMMCQANTTLQYFELPNVYSNGTFGPLLSAWPEDTADNFQYNSSPYDYYLQSSDFTASFAQPTDPSLYASTGYAIPQTPGPLMTAALALFGNGSLFDIATTNALNVSGSALTSTATAAGICFGNTVPFNYLMQNSGSAAFREICSPRFNASSVPEPALALLSDWLQVFYPNGSAFNGQMALETAMFMANEAVLTEAAAGAPLNRLIRGSSGSQVVKPAMSLAVMIIISALIALQLLGLLLLLVYIYSTPTWTAQLDALAMARIGQSLPDNALPALGSQAAWGPGPRAYRGPDGVPIFGASVHSVSPHRRREPGAAYAD